MPQHGSDRRTCRFRDNAQRQEMNGFTLRLQEMEAGDFRLRLSNGNGRLNKYVCYQNHRNHQAHSGNPALAIGNGVNSSNLKNPLKDLYQISELVKGTAVYTSSFTVPTELSIDCHVTNTVNF